MQLNWEDLARQVGSLSADGELGERGGTHFAELALERILGEAVIRDTVAHILEYEPGSELAMNVLQHITSWVATEIAYQEYKSSTGERAARAAWLIRHIAHPQSVEWIREFLLDDNVATLGMALPDQLLWSQRIEPDTVEDLLRLAEGHPIPNVREQVAGVRGYLAEWAKQ